MMDTPTSGRRRAALRVKQKRRNDQKQWTTEGKLLHRQPTSRPLSRPIKHKKPWDERFIYDHDEPENGNKARLHNPRRNRSQQGTDGKENITNESGQQLQSSETRSIRHYTERADGEIMLEFTRREILPSGDKTKAMPLSPVVTADGKCHDLIGTRSIGVSPFDMAKVKAALDAHEEEEINNYVKQDESEQATLHENTAENKRCSLPRREAQTFPIDESKLEEFLEAFEDLLYTMELEEELLRRDLAHNKTSLQIPCLSIKDESDIISDREEDCIGNTQPRRSIPKEREDTIVKYIQASQCSRAQQERLVTKNGHLKYHEIVEILAESILDCCIKDIAEEVDDCINDLSEQIFKRL